MISIEESKSASLYNNVTRRHKGVKEVHIKKLEWVYK